MNCKNDNIITRISGNVKKKKFLFQQRVDDASFSGSSDSPEGGFDALMQAVVCKVSIQPLIDHSRW